LKLARTVAKDYDDKRLLILKTAAKVYADQGFDRASMVQVAKACNISKANIYHYYDSKNAILFDILDTYLRGLRDRICGVSADNQTPQEFFRALVLEILVAYQGADNEHRVQANSIQALEPAQHEILLGYQRDMVRHLSAAVAANLPNSLTSDSATVHAITMSVFGMLNWFYMWNREADAQTRAQYATLVADLTLKGILGL